MAIKCDRFNASWAPIGTVLRIIETVSANIRLVYVGYVSNYSDDMRIMNISTIDGRNIDINIDDLYKYIIERCVPEGALEADTIGLDYDELMTIVGEKD
jgi:hypothetical protein